MLQLPSRVGNKTPDGILITDSNYNSHICGIGKRSGSRQPIPFAVPDWNHRKFSHHLSMTFAYQ